MKLLGPITEFVQAITAPVAKAVSAAATSKVKESSAGRRRGETWVDAAGVRHVISPDDDLADLEHPKPAGGWLTRRDDWLHGRSGRQ